MKKFIFFSCLSLALLVLASSTKRQEELEFDKNKPVAEVLKMLGDASPAHQPNLSIEGISVDSGRDIVMKGFASTPKGGKTSKQSKHFVCTSCHNIEREDPDLSQANPQARLKYVREKGLPFLQGTSLYGVVNRNSFYNGDYEKKYGDLVKPARNDLREAIQLCAIECSQGRALDEWEMESVLAYLWTIDLKMHDLNLSDTEWKKINTAMEKKQPQASAIELMKSKYLQASPATFIDPPADRKTGHSRKGNPENGKLIYELSCLHCHKGERYSYFNLDNSKYSFQFLEKHFPKYTQYSVYQVARYGTKPLPGKRAYMPNYTAEKMTEEMLEDLRAYIEMLAWKTQ